VGVVLVRLEEQGRFSTPLEEGFEYITNPANWPDYWPGLIRIEPGGRWREPGDRMTLVLRLLRRYVRLEMTLERFERPGFVGYRTVQAGLPDARHERIFSQAGDGFDYRVAVEYEPRAGLRGVVDRVFLRRAITRALRTTIQNLEVAFRENRPSAGIPGSETA
jgi:Polyketide cyclase / dehydrase and lipid transport